ncbi:hypothetical protein PpBr36_08346 [Pyricularia pennisetigena]|uniref:hypothetical protein n=1 Tax=Pyricularia pennisetigena TaxID=1578925 RepID=UPI00114F6ABD|nr:hypothetical protein PpBr36_08346 [Pyricularia pennisetigena]TLS24790.1 hypothetical protein PpBr36_08346 [Pyricularia pennisetigena]
MNATHFRYPNPRPSRQPIDNPHIAAITFGFNWPGVGYIQGQFVGKRILHNGQDMTIVKLSQFCQITYNANFDRAITNVSNPYTEEHTRSTDCRPFLGDACVDEWESTIPSRTLCDTSRISLTGGACRSIFRLDRSWLLRPENLARNYSSGDIATRASTGAMNGTNMTSYDAVNNKVHVVMVNLVFEVRGPSDGNRTSNITGRRQPLCIRINTGQADEAEGVGTSTILGRG